MNGEGESGPRCHHDPILLPVKCPHGEQSVWKQPINIIMFIAVLVVFTIAVAALIDTKIRLHEVENKLQLYTNLEVQGGGGGNINHKKGLLYTIAWFLVPLSQSCEHPLDIILFVFYINVTSYKQTGRKKT